MNEALELVYYVYDKLMKWLFTSYFFDGVSLGMFMLVCFIFVVLLRYLLAIPRINVGFGRKRESNKNEDD